MHSDPTEEPLAPKAAALRSLQAVDRDGPCSLLFSMCYPQSFSASTQVGDKVALVPGTLARKAHQFQPLIPPELEPPHRGHLEEMPVNP